MLQGVLEALRKDDHGHGPPRASLLFAPGELAGAGIWMGGAHTPHGEPIALDAVSAAWVIDCAGDMPSVYRAQAGRWFARVFADLDDVPVGFAAIREMVVEVAASLAPGAGGPEHLYVVCQHGMNRSGLVAGLVLRELGVAGPEAVERITAARPGALSNQAFRRLLVDGE